MKIEQICIHNFRSIRELTISLQDYSLLIGGNNSGKSNIIDALRAFYEKDIKFDVERDFPKFKTPDNESWVEVQYGLSTSEADSLKSDYLLNDNSFRVRRWLSPAERFKQGYVAYEGGSLSSNLFYGWKSYGQSKLGNVIYVPAATKLEDHTKLTGPSALRDLVNDILKPIIRDSSAFTQLSNEFEHFSQSIKSECTSDSRSLRGLEDRINEQITGWNVRFNLELKTPQEDEIVKNLVKHTITDKGLDESLDSGSFGHGLQRYLIFALIGVAASYTARREAPKKKDFAPELELLLFEEPEAFLHPPQQTVLDSNLRRLVASPNHQVLIATHSPHFVSYNSDEIPSMTHVRRLDAQTDVGRISQAELTALFEDNQALRAIITDQPTIPERDIELELAREAARYFVWLNPERCSAFFADHVLLVEGPTEQALINYLLRSGELDATPDSCFVMDCGGKYNFHRFMALLGSLKIYHSVLFDRDEDRVRRGINHAKLNAFIEAQKNPYTTQIGWVEKDVEAFLGIPSAARPDLKPINAITFLKNGRIPQPQLADFKNLVNRLVTTSVAATTPS
jgi:predicted ATP-dependent endonuclease of OLD family